MTRKKRKNPRACARNRSADAKRITGRKKRKRKGLGRAGIHSDDRTKMKTRKMRRRKKFGPDDAARQERALGSERGPRCLFQPFA
jgi:hypothetical protein